MAKKASKKSPGKGDKMAALRRFIRARGAEYLDDPNVNSIGIGYKNGDGEIAIVFSVDLKAEPELLAGMDTRELPKTIEVEGMQIPTDVVQRKFEPSFKLVQAEAPDIRKVRQDPIRPGISIAHTSVTAGTLGMIVFDAETGTPCALSNWHVMNGPTGAVGDTIVQPGPFDDSNTAGNACGRLLRSHLGAAGDCAIAQIQGRSFDRSIFDLDVVPRRLADVELGDRVVKSGRTTGKTYGMVRRVDVMTKLNYGGGVGEMTIGGFEIGLDPNRIPANGEISMGGDSGSVWMIADGAKATDIVAGLHFAGESGTDPDEHAVACYPKSVQQKLNFLLEPPAPLVIEGDAEDAFGARSGFDAQFLGLLAPMPEMSLGLKRDAVNFGRAQTIPYTHFSVALSARFRLPRFVAWNIDGTRRVTLPRKGFALDPRVDAKHQLGEELYRDNALDRGHIARRADLAWGPVPEAQQANRDSFYFTNIAPQHQSFNQSMRGGLWGLLENLILEEADAQDIRVSVLGGPIFAADDPEYRGARIPREFWKLIAYRAADDRMTCSAFVLSQNDLVADLEAIDFDPFRMFQVSVKTLEGRTGLGLAAYRGADVMANPERITHGREMRAEIEALDTGEREVFEPEDLAF